jgi:hypothetical protein
MATRRRILEKLTLTEISGVDRPCQEGARVTIMKRDFSAEQTGVGKSVDDLAARITKIKQQLEKWSDASRAAAIANRQHHAANPDHQYLLRQLRGQRSVGTPAQRALAAQRAGATGTDDYYAHLEHIMGIPKGQRTYGSPVKKAWPSSTHHGWGGGKSGGRVGGGGGRTGRVGGAPVIGRVSSKAIAAHRLKVLALFHANRGKSKGRHAFGRHATVHKSWDDAVSKFDIAMLKAGFNPSQARGDHGRWSAVGAAIGRGARATGRAIRATGDALWAGYTSLPIEHRVLVAAGAAGLVGQGINYARMTPEQRAQAKTDAKAAVVAHLRRQSDLISANQRALVARQHAFAAGASGVGYIQSLLPGNKWEQRSQARQAEAALADFRSQGRVMPPAPRPGVTSVPAAGTRASVPFMVTRDMKQQLLDRGYTLSHVKNMTPERMHRIIAEYVTLKRLGAGAKSWGATVSAFNAAATSFDAKLNR